MLDVSLKAVARTLTLVKSRLSIPSWAERRRHPHLRGQQFRIWLQPRPKL